MRMLIFASSIMILSGQTEPAFEVATVKPANSKNHVIGLFTYPGGRVSATQYTLAQLIEDAFEVQPFQIVGGPGWIAGDRFDIEAKPPASSLSSQAKPQSDKTPPNDEQRRMLQTLLADRFQLKFHRGTKEGPAYLLVRTNKPLKLVETKDKTQFSWVGSPEGGQIAGRGIAGTNASMDVLAARLSPYLRRPVENRTGLEGSFDFKFVYSSDDPQPDLISSILTSVQALGLRLEAAKGPVATMVIDHAEKPSDN